MKFSMSSCCVASSSEPVTTWSTAALRQAGDLGAQLVADPAAGGRDVGGGPGLELGDLGAEAGPAVGEDGVGLRVGLGQDAGPLGVDVALGLADAARPRRRRRPCRRRRRRVPSGSSRCGRPCAFLIAGPANLYSAQKMISEARPPQMISAVSGRSELCVTTLPSASMPISSAASRDGDDAQNAHRAITSLDDSVDHVGARATARGQLAGETGDVADRGVDLALRRRRAGGVGLGLRGGTLLGEPGVDLGQLGLALGLERGCGRLRPRAAASALMAGELRLVVGHLGASGAALGVGRLVIGADALRSGRPCPS